MRDTVFSGRVDELTGSFLIKYEWWQCCAKGNRPPPPGLMDELSDIALEHICALRLEGYTEGELFQVLDNDVFRGYWKYQKY